MSLCFREAFLAKQDHKITEEEYLGHLIAHLRGVRHPQDSDRDVIVSKFDPFGASIREMALRTDYEPLQDTTPYEKLFNSCLTGSLDQVRSNLKQLGERQSLQIPLQPLATLAASKGHAEILQLCLDEGVIFDANLDRAAQLGANKNPAMKRLLELSEQEKQTLDKKQPNQRHDPDQLQKRFGDLPW